MNSETASRKDEGIRQGMSKGAITVKIPIDHVVDQWVVRDGADVRKSEVLCWIILLRDQQQQQQKGQQQAGVPSSACAPKAAAHKRPKRKKLKVGSSVSTTPSASSSSTTPTTTTSSKSASTETQKGDAASESGDNNIPFFLRLPSTSLKSTIRSEDTKVTSVHHQPKKIKVVAPISGVLHILNTTTKTEDDTNIVIASMEPCQHPAILDGLCAVCGQRVVASTAGLSSSKRSSESSSNDDGDGDDDDDSRPSLKAYLPSTSYDANTNGCKPGTTGLGGDNSQDGATPSTTTITVSGGMTLQVSTQEARNLSLQNTKRLEEKRKLNLVLDLDHTLVHATSDARATKRYLSTDMDTISKRRRDDVRSLVLPIVGPPSSTSNTASAPTHLLHCIKLRPHVVEFLQNPNYELSVYTAGTRSYAEQITMILSRAMIQSPHDHHDILQRQTKRNALQQQIQQQREVDEKRTSNAEDQVLDNDHKDRKVDTTPQSSAVVMKESDEEGKDRSENKNGSKKRPLRRASDNDEVHGDDKAISTKGVANGNSHGGDHANDGNVKTKGSDDDNVLPPAKKKRRRVRFGENTTKTIETKVPTVQELQEELEQVQSELDQMDEMEQRALTMRQRVFGSRIVSRTDVSDLGWNVKSVKRIFPCGGTMAVIVDDREDVWAKGNAQDKKKKTPQPNNGGAGPEEEDEPPPNLLLVRPYHWKPFVGFADVNNASGKDLSVSSSSSKPATQKKKTANDDDDDHEEEEKDVQLMWTRNILDRLHGRYYSSSSSAATKRLTVPELLTEMRGEVLAGCHLVFSGIIPIQDGSRKRRTPSTPLMRYARELGARVSMQTTTSSTNNEDDDPWTHVIAERDRTAKVLQARTIPGCYVVRKSWLMECWWRIKRASEMEHLLTTPPDVILPPRPRNQTSQQQDDLGTNVASGNGSLQEKEKDDDDDDDEEDDDDLIAELEMGMDAE